MLKTMESDFEPLTVCEAGVLVCHVLFALLVLLMMYAQSFK